MSEVLVLNTSYMPVNIIPWQDAICLWYTDKAEILDSYEDKMLHSWKSAMAMPAVIRLYSFVKPHRNISFYESFTRKNVWLRDESKCQYCGKPVALNSFTFDHVKSKSSGGLTTWTNIVCSCLKCNTKKGNKTLEEAGMKLIKKPIAPVIADNFNDGVIKRIKGMSKVFSQEKWFNYLYWESELQKD